VARGPLVAAQQGRQIEGVFTTSRRFTPPDHTSSSTAERAQALGGQNRRHILCPADGDGRHLPQRLNRFGRTWQVRCRPRRPTADHNGRHPCACATRAANCAAAGGVPDIRAGDGALFARPLKQCACDLERHRATPTTARPRLRSVTPSPPGAARQERPCRES